MKVQRNKHHKDACDSNYRKTLAQSSAQTTYEILQEKFPDGTQGHRFAEMAAEFWHGYQSSQSLSQACLTAINYAEEYKNDMFAYLGNTEQDTSHGTQSHYYTPWDMCPFE